MPFLILPRDRALDDASLSLLSARLCPYSQTATKILETRDHQVWGTSLAQADSGVIRNSLALGTAAFELRSEDRALSVATDPLGTCPLWYARSGAGWIVSPEAKAIAALAPVALRADVELTAPGPRPAGWSPFENVRRLPQGCRLLLTGAEALIKGACERFDTRSDVARADWGVKLAEALIDGFKADSEPMGSFVSGGIDSSIACALARRRGAVRTFSLGSAYGDEFPQARALAQALDCSHAEVHLDASNVLAELDRVVFENEVFDGLSAEILLQFSTLYGAAQGSCRRIITGYGSDLLFDGMLRHAGYMAAVGLESTPELIERTRWTGELAPFVHWSRGIAAEHVFWKPAVMRTALRVPRELCFVDGVEKHVLRDGAVRTGLLPAQLAFQEKRALSDGTRVNRLFSEALGLEEAYGYEAKTRLCIERFGRLFSRASP